MPSAEQLAKRLSVLARRVDNNAANALQEVVIEIGRSLVFDTPVDTGLARSNWLASPSSVPDLSFEDPRDVVETIEEIAFVARLVGSDGTVTIANGGDKVPYLGLLNDGSSRQAPAGFVKIAVIEGAIIAGRLRLLTRTGGVI